jgi:uncharacterized protein
VIRYLDTSAVAKVIQGERHTPAVCAALRAWSADDLVSSQLMATELHRLAARLGIPSAVAVAAVSAFEVIHVECDDFIAARSMAPPSARTLDLLHVAVASRVRADVIVTYDQRQAEVAAAVGLAVVAPD